ncbi:GNAT family N-acetyltransferase [Actinomyces sp. B33]|uniref:GNAT family N-acetyltransferase n=1 Tax=Actinomyces sp. B33 TaxID=2942131 RepID=UPI0023412CB8|nr:GNAT family N-acetyltransferase [Actinomyces sp. B33]MDC4233298.1 GNAT family N-acetyltransferase [Actinomyces sp. B33]
MVDVVVVELGPERSELLRRATLGNMNWCAERFTMQDVLSNPELVHYTEFRPSRGDFGVVARTGTEEVGVCWASFLPGTDPGYGFIDGNTPEVSLWVAAALRGQGVGRRLLVALIEGARQRGIEQISLSVESDNYARRLYSSCGFEEVVGREADGVMLLRLDPTTP